MLLKESIVYLFFLIVFVTMIIRQSENDLSYKALRPLQSEMIKYDTMQSFLE